MREVAWRIDKIIARNNDRIVFEGKMHGLEIKIPGCSSKVKDFTEKQNAAMLNAIEAAKTRKAKEYGRKNCN